MAATDLAAAPERSAARGAALASAWSSGLPSAGSWRCWPPPRSPGVLPLPSPDRHGHARAPCAAHRGALAGHRRPRPRRRRAAAVRRAHVAGGRAVRAADRPGLRRRRRHAGRLLPRPPGHLGQRRRRRAARVPAAGAGARGHRLPRPVAAEHDAGRWAFSASRRSPAWRAPRRSRWRSASSSPRRARSAPPMRGSCCTNCCPTWRCRWPPSCWSAWRSRSSSRAP